jgi:hypothetical protein
VAKDSALETATQQMTMIKMITAATAADQEEDMPVDWEAAALLMGQVATLMADPVADAAVVQVDAAVVDPVAAAAVAEAVAAMVVFHRMSTPVVAAEKIRGLDCYNMNLLSC